MLTRRFLLVTGFVVSAFASICAGQSGGQSPGLKVDPADIPKLIEAARAAGVSVEYTSDTEHAAGDGASAKAVGDKLDQKLDSTAPGAHLSGGGGATGGDTRAAQHAEAAGSVWFRLALGAISLGCFAGCAYFLWRTPPCIDDALYCAVGGDAAAFAALFPMAAVFILAGLAAAAIALYVLRARGNATATAVLARTSSAYDAIVDGVASSPAAASVAASIKAQASSADLVHIQQTAAANGNPINLT